MSNDVKEGIVVREWEYRTEGYMNIIFGYKGTNPKFKGHILRIKKVPYSKIMSSIHYDFHAKLMKNFFKKEEILLNYYSVPINQNVLKSFQKKISSALRPKVYARDIAIKHEKGELQKDFFSFDIFEKRYLKRSKKNPSFFSVEIKPKWGIKPLLGLSKSKYSELKRTKCRYCMHQMYKLKLGEIKKVSNFCPLKLFCGDEKEQLECLKDLKNVPQNNFGLFKNGKKVKDIIGLDVLSIIVKILKQSDILMWLQRVQLLNLFDIEFVEKIYTKLKERNQNELNEMIKNVNESEETLKWSKLITIPKVRKMKCGKVDKDQNKLCDEEVMKKCFNDIEYALNFLRKFIVSKSAKDCSILFSFYEVGKDFYNECKKLKKEIEGIEGFVECKKKIYHYCLGIIDMDKKNMTKIPKWCSMDLKICKNYMSKNS